MDFLLKGKRNSEYQMKTTVNQKWSALLIVQCFHAQPTANLDFEAAKLHNNSPYKWLGPAHVTSVGILQSAQ